MKKLKENSLFLAVILFLYVVFREKIPLVSFIVCIFLWYRKTGIRILLPPMLCFLIVSIPRASSALPECTTAVIREVHENYSVAHSGRYRFVIYCDETAYFDTVVEISGTFQEITGHVSFYGGDFSRTCRRKGIYFTVTAEPKMKKTPFSVRYMIQKKIEKIPDADTQKTLNKVLLGISSDLFEEGFLADSGIALSGLLSFLNMILRQVLYPKERKVTMIILTGLLGAVYRFPAAILIRFVSDVLSCLTEEREVICGITLIFVMLVMPSSCFTASFLMPALFRIISCSHRHQKVRRFLFSCILQSMLFSECVPVHILLFPFLNRISGLMWLLGFVSMITGMKTPAVFIMSLDRLMSAMTGISFSGNMLGAGLPFFLLLVYSRRNSEHFHLYTAFLFYLFLVTGLFHPFAEVTFINVGQGDSILVRMPLNRENILIDTGKPSAGRYVTSLLDAKGITRIGTLFITHSDSDHSGNKELIEDQYSVGETVTEHFACQQGKYIGFLDLNTIENEDENQSSLVICFCLNRLVFLMTGDADEVTERAVIRDYPGLRAHILKLSHHGSATSSCGKFLDTVCPDTAVISCGDERIYHHPSEEVVQRLLSRHIPYFLTREEGDITFLALGPLNFMVTASGKIAIIGS